MKVRAMACDIAMHSALSKELGKTYYRNSFEEGVVTKVNPTTFEVSWQVGSRVQPAVWTYAHGNFGAKICKQSEAVDLPSIAGSAQEGAAEGTESGTNGEEVEGGTKGGDREDVDEDDEESFGASAGEGGAHECEGGASVDSDAGS